MKKMLSVAFFALSIGVTSAQACMDEKMHDKLEKVAMKLDLSKEQRAQIHTIHQESKQKLMPLHDQMKGIQHRVDETYRTNSMNSFKLNGFVREEKDLVGQVIKIRMDERYKINELLTEKQRMQFSQMMDHHKKEHHKKEHHKKKHD